MKLIRYFFYKIYSFSLSNGENDAGWAMTIVSIFGIANVYSAIGMIQIIFQGKTPKVTNTFIIIASGILMYLYYVYLIKNGKAKEIIKEFKEMESGKTTLNLFLALYIIGSICLFIYTGNVVRGLNQP